MKAIGIKPENDEGTLDLHSLRHSYITWLVASGTPPKLAQQLARHSDINLTMNVYTHLTLHDAHGAVEKIPSILAGPTEPERLALPKTGTDGNFVAPNLAPTDAVLRLRLRTDEETANTMDDLEVNRNSKELKTLEDDCGDMRTIYRSTPRGIRTPDRRIRNQDAANCKDKRDNDLGKSCDSLAPDLAPQDVDLAFLTEKWPTLSAAMRAGIIAMIRAV